MPLENDVERVIYWLHLYGAETISQGLKDKYVQHAYDALIDSPQRSEEAKARLLEESYPVRSEVIVR